MSTARRRSVLSESLRVQLPMGTSANICPLLYLCILYECTREDARQLRARHTTTPEARDRLNVGGRRAIVERARKARAVTIHRWYVRQFSAAVVRDRRREDGRWSGGEELSHEWICCEYV